MKKSLPVCVETADEIQVSRPACPIPWCWEETKEQRQRTEDNAPRTIQPTTNQDNTRTMKKRKHILPLAAAMGSLALIAGSAHAAVITPIGVTASAEWSTTTGAANNLLGPGITEVNPSDVTTWTHGNIEWNVAPREG